MRLLFNDEASGDATAAAFKVVCSAVELKTDDFRIGAIGALRPFVSDKDGGAPPLKIERGNKLSFRTAGFSRKA